MEMHRGLSWLMMVMVCGGCRRGEMVSPALVREAEMVLDEGPEMARCRMAWRGATADTYGSRGATEWLESLPKEERREYPYAWDVFFGRVAEVCPGRGPVMVESFEEGRMRNLAGLACYRGLARATPEVAWESYARERRDFENGSEIEAAMIEVESGPPMHRTVREVWRAYRMAVPVADRVSFCRAFGKGRLLLAEEGEALLELVVAKAHSKAEFEQAFDGVALRMGKAGPVVLAAFVEGKPVERKYEPGYEALAWAAYAGRRPEEGLAWAEKLTEGKRKDLLRRWTKMAKLE